MTARGAGLLSIMIISCAVPAAVAQVPPTHDDVVFASAPVTGGIRPLLLDLYLPTGGLVFPLDAPSPVVVHIHGGGWMGGSHDSTPGPLLPLRELGVAVASVGYRLSGEAIFPAQIHDVKAAIRFLRANAATYGLDASRIAATGPSAGGHLAALVATSGNAPDLEGTVGSDDEQSSAVCAASAFFAPCDLLLMQPDVATPPGSSVDHDAPSSPESRLIGFHGKGQGIGVLRANLDNPAPPFPAKAALARAASPLTHLDAADPPIFIAHGTADTVVPLRQSERLRDALVVAGIDHQFVAVAGAGHGGLGAAAESAMRTFLVARLQASGRTNCPCDLDGDGQVGGPDLGMLLGDWGGPTGDLTGDGTTDAADLGALLSAWGPCEAP
ncbi:MAG: hypothetical protein RIS86_166 [Planctomycetota bacterium]|jgi:acetyl esterase/lipase